MDKKRLSDFKLKTVNVFNQLDIPITLYAATEKDEYRKPRVGMWKALLHDHGLTEDTLDLDGSIFIGDAAGRPADGSRKKDFSCTDRCAPTVPCKECTMLTLNRDFAANIGIPFQTPEEYFLDEEAKPYDRPFDPSKYVLPTATQSLDASPALFSKKHNLDIVIFVGSPGSGKSTFYQKHLAPRGYARVNQDILKTRDKCVKVASDHLKEGESVAIDNTNRDRATRKIWVDLARNFNVPIRCIWFTAVPALCQHNDAVRALNKGHNPEKRTMLPSNAFPIYNNAFEEPNVKEGLEDITKVDFIFEGTEDEKEVWRMYWI
jgi:bifunctional polynucleotide phosphatase/kinase